jgi:hypothetical protein
MGIQLHEIGHNLGLLHSGETVTYDGKKFCLGCFASFALPIKKTDQNLVFHLFLFFIAKNLDHTCFMGNPSYEDDMHAMCFNGAKSWELNWYADNNGYRTSDPISSGNTVGAKMAALDDYLNGETTADHSVVLMIVDNSQNDDYYVMYNRKKGVNYQVVEYGDEVTITKGRAGEQSW